MNKQTRDKVLEIVKCNYDEIADQYNETRKKHLLPLWNEIVKIASEVKDGQKVLDIGCGNGRLLGAFENKKIEYLGIDNNEKLIEHAKINYSNNNFQTGDILDLGKISELNFDYVFSIAVIHHVPGKKLQIDALKQLKNKINENGKIIISAWNLWDQKKFRKQVFKYALLKLIKKNKMDFGDILFDWKNSQGQIVSQRYYHAFTRGGLKKIAKKAGLKIEKVFNDKFNYYLILKK